MLLMAAASLTALWPIGAQCYTTVHCTTCHSYNILRRLLLRGRWHVPKNLVMYVAGPAGADRNTPAALGVAAAPTAAPALLQLGPGKNAWTIGVQYPATYARIGDTLVRQPHSPSPCYQSCNAA